MLIFIKLLSYYSILCIFSYVSAENFPKINDEGMSKMLDWILPSSAKTLQLIYCADETNLTRTPPQLGSFKNFTGLGIRDNMVGMTIKTGSIFSSRFNFIDFSGGTVADIEEGAFQGIK